MKLKFQIITVLLFVFSAICSLAQDGDYSDIGEHFLETHGSNFMLNGKTIYMNGTNNYYLFYKDDAMIDEIIDDADAMNLRAIRTWCFANGTNDGDGHDNHVIQPEQGVVLEEDYQGGSSFESGIANLDYAISKAKEKNIGLILPLVNNWEDFGGMEVYESWYGDDFYSGPKCRQGFKDYIKIVFNHVNPLTGLAYKNEPAIFIWELANEPRAPKERTEEFLDWVADISSYIKSIDPNHLVSTGSEG